MSPLHFDRNSRVMVLAPHPDDETLATGGLLQAARAAGAAVRVVFLTSGENNPWPQRLLERRWRIGPTDCERWGRLRRKESLDALAVLGVPAEDALFLGLPDQDLTRRLLRDSERTATVIADVIRSWKPTFLAGPSPFDLHPDHSAAALLVSMALAHLPADQPRFERVEFIVHSRASRKIGLDFAALDLTDEQRAAKLRAIRCHASQLKWYPKRLTARARTEELFIRVQPTAAEPGGHHPVSRACIDNGDLRLELAMRPCAGAFGPATLYLVGGVSGRVATGLSIRLPEPRLPLDGRARRVEILDVATGEPVATGEYRGGPRRGQLVLPLGALERADRLFVKLERRFGFFDEAGWRELDINVPSGQPDR